MLPLTLLSHTMKGHTPKSCDGCHLPGGSYDRRRRCQVWGKPFETPFGYGRPDSTPSMGCPEGKFIKGRSGLAGLSILRRSRCVVGGET